MEMEKEMETEIETLAEQCLITGLDFWTQPLLVQGRN